MADGQWSDDVSIPDDAVLWRRIPPWHVTYDWRQQRWRPSSAAFEDDPDGHPMSVVIGGTGRNPRDVLGATHADYGVWEITAGLARQYGQVVVRAPTPEEPAHALIVGKKRESTGKAFARGGQWAVRPPAHPTDDPPDQ
jgi:hypothetical protein